MRKMASRGFHGMSSTPTYGNYIRDYTGDGL